MKPLSPFFRFAPALIGWQVFICQLSAVTNTFIIDPQRSGIVLSGNVSGNSLNPQGPGSLSNVVAGTLILDLTSSTIQFTGGSLIDPPSNGSWAPLPGGGAGTAPADYAGTASIVLVSAQAAVRNILLDVTSPVLTLSNGTFDSSSLVFQFLTNSGGSLDYRVTGFISSSGGRLLDGLSTNGVSSGASLATNGNDLTLTLPVDASRVFTLISSNDATLRLQGQLVATAPIGAPPLVVSVRINGSQIVLEWPTGSGQTFAVETSPNLVSWGPASGLIVVNSATTTWTGEIGGGSGFYRVVRNP